MRRVSGFRIVVLASGSGTNLQAILDTLHGRDGIEVVGVGSDKPGARALERARAAGVETAVFPRDEYADREARDAAMGDWIESRGADLVVLAGYMQLLSAPFVARFRNRIVNIHPALLPAFPGLDAIGQALAAGVETTGVTVHFVDEGVDTGPAIAAARGRRCRPSGDREELEAAVHAVEHELYPEAIRMIAEGRVRIDAERPAQGRRSMSEAAADTATETVERRRDPGAPGADLGLRQDRRRRLRQGPGRRSGSRSSPPAAPRRRCARPGSRSPTSPSSPARRRSSAAG